ncbi:MAG: PaaX family transcriptional regulator C-terminal domain-containing protein [Anaerolineae bacterium]
MGYRTQDLIFTLYGDYIAPRGDEAWIGHIIELMGVLNISPQAVRSTLSRMMRKGWLRSRREGRHSFYAITPKTESLLADGRRRIYHPRQEPWDGCWHILTYSISEDQRHLRNRLRQRLIWLGFGRLGSAVWISPRDLRREVRQVTERLKISDQVDVFSGEYLGLSDPRDLVERCWNLDQLHSAYQEFIDRHRAAWQHYTNQVNNNSASARQAFVRRFLLVHEYRSFPYVDPNLPSDLLPDDWLGYEAIHLFQSYAALLAPKANEFVDVVLSTEPSG